MVISPPSIAYRRTDNRSVVTLEERRLFEQTPPAYLGEAILILRTETSRTGAMRLKLRLGSVDDAVRHPFRGLRWSRRLGEGQRLRLGLSRAEDDGPDEHVFGGEASLGFWAEDCADGVTVTFQIGSDPEGAADRELLRNLEEGAVLSLGCWLVGDDDMPVAPRPPAGRGGKLPFASMDATRQAGIKCGDPEFREWCRVSGIGHMRPEAAAALPAFTEDPAGFAEAVVRSLCRVESRSALKAAGPAGDEARRRWMKILRLFGEWRASRKEPPPHDGNR